MRKIIFLAMFLLVISQYTNAVERKNLKDVNTDTFSTDTQASPVDSGSDHMVLTWWIPNEFWEAILSKDETIADADKNAMLDALAGVSLLGVVQGDITRLAAFNYYSKEEIEKNIIISFIDEKNKKHKIIPMNLIKPDLEVVLGIFKPILSAAMGNLGSNFHFYVLNDFTGNSSRLIDPYKKGRINIQLLKRNNESLWSNIELPVNSLFIPRICPNGKEAHISWEYCPWSGKQL